uniref:RING-type domain-containing protein n=1 Tax=Amphimedon queenslandica TaxID=400682 RepID=A0A1X7ULD4_AMPQE
CSMTSWIHNYTYVNITIITRKEVVPYYCKSMAMAHFSKEEFSFVKELPEHMEIECPVCLHILTDPHLVSCCGHNFCGSCIKRVKASNGSCPMCNKKKYRTMADKKCSRIINGLEVYCSNKEKGCYWKGELKNMSTHLNKEKREGECQYEEVKCRYRKCQVRKQRRYLRCHENTECLQRPFQCQYCRKKGTFLSITKDHYEECRQYPVTCPNKCVSTNMPRHSVTAHVNRECPLESVDCVLSWAGCNDKPLRKDIDEHTADTKHMTLLAVVCGQLKKENEQLKEENEQIKQEMRKEVDKLTKEIADVKSCIYPEYPLLPVDVKEGSKAVHFYTSAFGRLMSARVMRGNIKNSYGDHFILLAFHGGKFNPKLSKIFAKYRGNDTPLIEDTEATYEQLPLDILNEITFSWMDDDITVPQGVIKIKLGNYFMFGSYPATIYTQYS